MKNKRANALRQPKTVHEDVRLSRAVARMFIVSGLRFTRNLNRGFEQDSYDAAGACGRKEQRLRCFERVSGSIEALFVAGMITLASAERCACLLRGYCINNEWARRDADESFSQAMDGVEVW